MISLSSVCTEKLYLTAKMESGLQGSLSLFSQSFCQNISHSSFSDMKNTQIAEPEQKRYAKQYRGYKQKQYEQDTSRKLDILYLFKQLLYV